MKHFLGSLLVLRRRAARSLGFTMIELLAVITLIAIILLISVPALNGNSDKARQSEAGQQLAIGYRTARNESLGRANAYVGGSVDVNQLADDMNRAQPQLKVQPISVTTGLKPRKLYLLSTGTDANNLALLFLDSSGVLWKLTAGQTGSPTVTKNAVGQTLQDTNYYNTVLADSPVGFWELNDTGTAAFDDSRKNNGVLSGTYTQGVAGALNDPTNKATTFDGSSGKVTVANSASLNPTAGLTMEAWVKTSTTGVTSIIVRKANQYLLETTSTNKLRADLWVGGANTVLVSPGTVSDGAWHHVVVTWDGTTVRMYIDGTQVATTPLSGALDVTGTDVTLASAGSGSYFNGQLDEVALYGSPLSAGRVTAHYAAR